MSARDPKIDPIAGDRLNIQGTEYTIVSHSPCCDAHGTFVGYRESRNRRACTFGMPIEQWRNHCVEFPTRVTNVASTEP